MFVEQSLSKKGRGVINTSEDQTVEGVINEMVRKKGQCSRSHRWGVSPLVFWCKGCAALPSESPSTGLRYHSAIRRYDPPVICCGRLLATTK